MKNCDTRNQYWMGFETHVNNKETFWLVECNKQPHVRAPTDQQHLLRQLFYLKKQKKKQLGHLDKDVTVWHSNYLLMRSPNLRLVLLKWVVPETTRRLREEKRIPNANYIGTLHSVNYERRNPHPTYRFISAIVSC